MAGTNYKSGLAIARAKQMIQSASKVQALQNFYNQFNQQQEEQEEGERMVVAKAHAESDHKVNLAMARSLNYVERVSGSVEEAGKTFINILEGPKWKAPFAGLEMAHHFRQQVKDHDNSPFVPMLIWALVVDIVDFAWPLGILFKIPLFYFLFGRGTWKVRFLSKRVFRKALTRIMIMMFGDCIPFIGGLPLSTISVLYAWHVSAKEAKKARKAIKELEKEEIKYNKLPPNQEAYAERITDYGDGRSEYEEYEEAYAQAA